LVVGSLALVAAILVQSGRRHEVGRFCVCGAFVLAILPMFTFSEREHLALALMLPALFLGAARAENRDVALAATLVAAIGAGLALAIKPPFALALLLPALLIAWHRRSIRILVSLEYLVAAAIVLTYAAIVFIFFNAYLTKMVPMLAETYLLARRPLVDLLLDPSVLSIGVAGAALASVLPAGQAGGRHRVLLAASAGFGLAYLEQGKGWRYHLYPALALVFLVFLSDALPRLETAIRDLIARRPGSLREAGLLAVILLCLATLVPFLKYRNGDSLPLIAAVRGHLTHPSILAISTDIGIGHPFARAVAGEWVGTVCSQWLTEAAAVVERDPGIGTAEMTRLEGWIAWDRDVLANDLGGKRPDLVLFDHKTMDRAALTSARPDIGRRLEDYQPMAVAGEVELLVRRDLAGMIDSRRQARFGTDDGRLE